MCIDVCKPCVFGVLCVCVEGVCMPCGVCKKGVCRPCVHAVCVCVEWRTPCVCVCVVCTPCLCGWWVCVCSLCGVPCVCCVCGVCVCVCVVCTPCLCGWWVCVCSLCGVPCVCTRPEGASPLMTSHQQVRRPPTQAVYNDADTRMNRCSHPTQHPSLGATLELVSYVIKRDFFCHNTPLHDLSTRSFVRHSCLVAYLAHVVTLFNSSALVW